MEAYSHLPDEDQKLITEARSKCWWDIHPEEAISDEARSILDSIARRGYHRDEARAGMS